MPAPIVLVVFVAASDAGDGSTTAMLRATREALGADAVLTVREFQQPPSDDEALSAAEILHASAVAEIVWLDPRHLRAALRVHVEGATRWVDRQLGFEAADAPLERGRTLGFALVSMLPERAPAPADAKPLTPPTRPPVADERGAGREETSPRFAPEQPVPTRAVEVAAIGSVGLGGYAGGIGAAIGGRWSFAPNFALRVGGGARAGEVAPAQASSLVVFGSLGVAWEAPWRPLPPLSFGVRIDAMVLRQQLTHLSSDDPAPVRQARWITGADALLELSWKLSQSAGIIAGFGTELAFGVSDIYVAHARAAVVPVARGVSELGVRARF